MKRYIITIINLETNSIINLNRSEESIDSTIEKELGGYNNLMNAMTSNRDIDLINYQETGTTKDNKYMYSILCHKIAI